MIKLRFERIAQIIAVAAVGNDDTGISKFYLEADAEIVFSEYVKSQVHLNVVNGLYSRNLREYVEALWFLSGKTSYEQSALKVLRYFYSDCANFLINNGNPVKLVMKVDTEFFRMRRVFIDLEENVAQYAKEFDSVISGNLAVSDWEHAAILDYVRDADDLEQKLENYVLAYELNRYREQDELVIVESG